MTVIDNGAGRGGSSRDIRQARRYLDRGGRRCRATYPFFDYDDHVFELETEDIDKELEELGRAWAL